MNIGVIGRADNSGLGTMTVDFCREMKPAKTLVMHYVERGDTCPERIAGHVELCPPGHLSHERAEKFLDGIDVLVGFETFYDPAVIAVAMRRKVKTVLFPMWECTPDWCKADLYILLSDQDKKFYQGMRTNWPISRTIRPAKTTRRPPAIFMHRAGSLGLNGRNGTQEVLQASKYLKDTPAHLIVQAGCDLPASWTQDANATVIQTWVPSEELYDGYDVLVFPMRIAGLSLPMEEAAASRIPTIVLDHAELSRYPAQMRVRTTGKQYHTIGNRKVEYLNIDVDHLGETMRGLALGDIKVGLPPEPPTWEEFKSLWRDLAIMGVIGAEDRGVSA